MKYNINKDLQSIREILNISQEEFAGIFHVEQATISRNEDGETEPSQKFIEEVYNYAFEKDIQLNRLKEMFWRDNLKGNEKILFHGAKNKIVGDIDIRKGRINNDFGQGFYTGESYNQAMTFVSNYDNSSVYYIRFDDQNLTAKKYQVNQEWMMTFAYYRGALDEYKEHPYIKEIISESRKCDYIVAPIADNRMFQIINAFINGEITDEQCKHCLAATNLGMQYIFISDKAVSNLEVIERCYICELEKKCYRNIRTQETHLGDNKVKLARKQYRGKGKYIDEILL